MAIGNRCGCGRVRPRVARMGNAVHPDARRDDPWDGVRPVADQLDRVERGLLLQPVAGERRLRRDPPLARAGDRRSAHPGRPRRLLLRRAHRGHRGVRCAGGDHRVDARGPGLCAHHGGHAGAHRQHHAGGLRIARHSDHDARWPPRAAARARRAGHHERALGRGRPSARALLALHSRLSRRPVRGLEADGRGAAGRGDRRRQLCGRPVRRVELRGTGADGFVVRIVFPDVGHAAAQGVAPARGVRRERGGGDCHRRTRCAVARGPRVRHLRDPDRRRAGRTDRQFRRLVDPATAAESHGAAPMRTGWQPALPGSVGGPKRSSRAARPSLPGLGVQLAGGLSARGQSPRRTRAARAARGRDRESLSADLSPRLSGDGRDACAVCRVGGVHPDVAGRSADWSAGNDLLAGPSDSFGCRS